MRPSGRELSPGRPVAMDIALGTQRLVDGFADDVEVCDDVSVPESQHFETEFGESGVAHSVSLGVGVLDPVNFDDEAFWIADEINDIAVNRFLPAELPREVMPQACPQQNLGLGHLLPQDSGNASRPRVTWNVRHQASIACAGLAVEVLTALHICRHLLPPP